MTQITAKRPSNFVQDRAIYDAVRAATRLCLSSAEIELLLCGAERESLLASLAAYAEGREDTAIVDRKLEPIISARKSMGVPPAAMPVTQPPSREANLKVYGQRSAFTVEASTTRDGDQTVMFEGAMASRDGNSFDWANKLVFQLTADELPVACAVVMGFAGRCEFNNHQSSGWAHKNLVIEHQGAKLFLKLTAKDHSAIAVPVEVGRASYLAALMLRQLASAMKVAVSDAAGILRTTTGRMLSQVSPKS